MYMIMLVLDNPDQLEMVVRAWDQAGVRGATIIESTGFHRLRQRFLPMRYVFPGGGVVEEGHLTLFVIVPSEEAVQHCLEATEKIVGDLNQPHTGVLAAWPLLLVKGVSSAGQV